MMWSWEMKVKNKNSKITTKERMVFGRWGDGGTVFL
jgi:hypothetical protein